MAMPLRLIRVPGGDGGGSKSYLQYFRWDFIQWPCRSLRWLSDNPGPNPPTRFRVPTRTPLIGYRDVALNTRKFLSLSTAS